MLEKITQLANENKKISDFHLRGGSDIAYRGGDIVIEPNSKISDNDVNELLKKTVIQKRSINLRKKKNWIQCYAWRFKI